METRPKLSVREAIGRTRNSDADPVQQQKLLETSAGRPTLRLHGGGTVSGVRAN
jgi:hypothetical protein